MTIYRLRAEGNKLVDATNRIVRLRGAFPIPMPLRRLVDRGAPFRLPDDPVPGAGAQRQV